LIEEKEKNVNELHDKLVKQQQENYELSEKIAAMNQIIFDYESKIQLFRLNKLGLVGSISKLPMLVN
jgi:uncharacterized coiled-coil DUF342 family protein